MSRILFAGGGTLGSVTPLLALVPQLRAEGHELRWIGTYTGPEKKVVTATGVPFYPMIAPKLRRYISWKHILVPFQCVIAILQSLFYIVRFRPHLALSAGGFVAVPVLWVARLCGARVIVHQLDVHVGLANQLSFPVATLVTTTVQTNAILHKRVEWVGSPVRDLTPTTKQFATLKSPIVFVFGGGTGAQALNALVAPEWCAYATVIHCTGEGKHAAPFTHDRYMPYPFLHEEMKEALVRADVVVCRAGIGTLIELAALKKAAVIIPMPDTHQEANAQFLTEHHAAIVRDQRTSTSATVLNDVCDVLASKAKREALGEALHQLFPSDATERYLKSIHDLLQ